MGRNSHYSTTLQVTLTEPQPEGNASRVWMWFQNNLTNIVSWRAELRVAAEEAMQGRDKEEECTCKCKE